MRSIRRSLTIGLLAGLLLLWLGAGTGVYFSVERSLLKSIDAELAVDARAIRFAGRGETPPTDDDARVGAQRIRERTPEYHSEDGDAFYQIWDSRGEVIEKSISLGDLDLPFPGKTSSEPLFSTSELTDGRKVRTMTYRAQSGGKGKGKGRRGVKISVLGKETTSIRTTLSSVFGGIVLTGILGGICAVGLVQFVLGRGLKPLDQLGEQATGIDISSTGEQFDDSGAPAELKPVYSRLNELMKRLTDGFERERQFSSNLAHEMRTPVAELKMISEVALKYPDQSGENTNRETLDIALQLERMIESLLMLGRVEAGRVQPNLETLNVRDFVIKKWQPFSRAADEKGLDVEIDIDSNLTWQADQDLLGHTLANLFVNAVDYTNSGQPIRLTTTGEGFQISNPAPELSDVDVEHLFDRLWRADDARTDSTHSGIGLSLARKCAEVQGFSLSADLKGDHLKFTIKKVS